MDAKKVKLSKFSSVLSQLRKERGISQKKAATELGISQALLSHYEKGIRECGLDFVIKCSEYYGVTTDYLLGVSDSRTGLRTSSFALEDSDPKSHSVGNLAAATSLLLDSVSASINDENAKKLIYDYYLLTTYRGALTLAKTGVLPKELFKLDYTVGRELASAAIAVQDAKVVFLEDKSRTGVDALARTAIHQLIEEAEEHIMENFVVE